MRPKEEYVEMAQYYEKQVKNRMYIGMIQIGLYITQYYEKQYYEKQVQKKIYRGIIKIGIMYVL